MREGQSRHLPILSLLVSGAHGGGALALWRSVCLAESVFLFLFCGFGEVH